MSALREDRKPKRAFITRSPCTESSDGMVIPLVCSESDLIGQRRSNDYKFLSQLSFGTVIFPLGKPSLPSQINSSDCDGDRFFVIWDDQNIVNQAETNKIDDPVYHKDELVVTTVRCESMDRAKPVDGIVVGKRSDGCYLVEVDSKPIRYEIWPREKLLDGRGYMKRVISHRIVKNSQTEFCIEWDDGTRNKWLSAEIKKENVTPPQVILEYVEENELLKYKDCYWMKDHIGDRMYTRTLTEIVDHRYVHSGEVELNCLYDDGIEEWEPLEGHRTDSKLQVSKYSKMKGLVNEKKWKTSGMWLKAIQDSIILNRSYITNLLKARCCGKWKKAFKKLGPHCAETIIWGRAYKKANELDKNVEKVELPARTELFG